MTRRQFANRPSTPFTPTTAARPGELTEIDTTPLDVMAILDEGIPGRVELTMIVDIATRTIGAGILRPAGTKAVDAALLLGRMLVPTKALSPNQIYAAMVAAAGHVPVTLSGADYIELLPIDPVPAVLRAHRRHRKLIHKHGTDAVHSAYNDAACLVRGWCERGAYPAHRDRRLTQLGERRIQIMYGAAALEAACYPDIISLPSVLISPALMRLGLSVSDDHPMHIYAQIGRSIGYPHLWPSTAHDPIIDIAHRRDPRPPSDLTPRLSEWPSSKLINSVEHFCEPTVPLDMTTSSSQDPRPDQLGWNRTSVSLQLGRRNEEEQPGSLTEHRPAQEQLPGRPTG